VYSSSFLEKLKRKKEIEEKIIFYGRRELKLSEGFKNFQKLSRTFKSF
jgi:hypothetical protein